MPHRRLLVGRKILLVEDEYFIAEDMARAFRASEAEIVGPVSNIEDALDLINTTYALDAAVLDINLQGELAFPVADALAAQGIPFVFATGYDATIIPAKYRTVTCVEKPVVPDKIGVALFA